MSIVKFVRVFGILLGVFGIGFLAGSTLEKNRCAEDQRDCRDTTVMTTPGPEKDFGYTIAQPTGQVDEVDLSPERRQRLEMESVPAQGNVPVVREGDTAVVPEWQLVDIEKYLDGRPPDRNGTTCGIEPGGIVTAIGTVKDLVLVSYQPPDSGTAGTPCDGGEVFFLKVLDFISYTDRAEAFVQQEMEQKRLVNSLLR